ncbi:hypothetical protein RE428_48830 (plasmid) [Marinobacter nanhaiticus D15-8W]|uniref:Conjugal transfer protein TrbC n=1 Tax=Marinobacter nanhaiticus D15-8W TaxID=626887 RepID=N6X133_9GAMM|nr:hypothetical protein [Marinobacter nanhaiticus]ENO17137.1 hypothetical protein J057_00689 [Marinobacter nanhaiticus D15-8W]BES73865.1 hypothetical protein RE428_48830 [Marinobacter nanhaiticus D15-8W]
MKQLKLYLVWLASFAFAPAALAVENNELDLGSPADGPLAAIGTFMQELIDFVGGPGVLFIVFVCAVAAIGLWVAAPKMGGTAIAMLLRVLVGGILIFNVALIITWLQGF